MKVTLRNHGHVRRSVHRDTATRTHFASTMLGRGPKNGHQSLPSILPYNLFGELREPSRENI